MGKIITPVALIILGIVQFIDFSEAGVYKWGISVILLITAAYAAKFYTSKPKASSKK